MLVAHGTREPAGFELAHELATRLDARVAFVDVREPGLGEVLDDAPGPVTVVPAFLAAGYHVRVDVPRAVAASGRDDVHVTPALGPHPAVLQRLGELAGRQARARAG